MNVGGSSSSAVRWAIPIAVLFSLSGCDVLDRARLDHVAPRRPPDEGGQGGGPALDSGVMTDSGVVMMDGGAVMDSGGVIDSGVVMDSGVVVDSGSSDAATEASIDAGTDAGADAGCEPSCVVDLCPSDPNKTEPGECGCGVDEAGAANCAALRTSLLHRYRFDGTGTVVTDAVSDADGTVINAALDGSGTLTLAGGTTNQYVELPDGIISALSNATFEVWLIWQGGGGWQRAFDFGDSNGTSGVTYVFVTPQRGGGTAALRSTMSLSGSATEVVIDGAAALPTGTLRHLAVVVDDQNNLLKLYLDGVLQNSVANTRALSDLNDVNNWLGRSQFSADPELSGTYHEFRIYNAALSDAQIAASFGYGADPVFLE